MLHSLLARRCCWCFAREQHIFRGHRILRVPPRHLWRQYDAAYFVQGGITWKMMCQKDCTTVLVFPKVPAHLEDWQGFVRHPLSVMFAVMLSIEPFLHFNAHQNDTEQYTEAHHLIHGYVILGIIATLLYYGLLLDSAVFSVEVSVFVFVCGRMLTSGW